MAGQRPSEETSEKKKAELRTAALTKRDEMTSAVAEEASRALCERLQDVEPLQACSSIAGYAPIRNEIDAGRYLVGRKAAGARLYFPRVSGEDTLEFIEVDSLDELSEGAFGVPEPSGEPAPIDAIEVFLVPGAAFDHQGRRLGFGRGYYDRALGRALAASQKSAQQDSERRDAQSQGPRRPLIVGICYDWQLIEGEVPTEPHDISMDVIATNEEAIWCSSRSPDIYK
ncbi:MAG: 5-formyltetrahydrofolate cyclo-ligase [Persicimonas sp.]